MSLLKWIFKICHVLKVGHYTQTWTRFFCFYKGKCPAEWVPVNEGMSEPMPGARGVVWATPSRYETSKMLRLLPDFYELFSPTLFSFLFSYYLNRSQKAMAPHSSTLAWKIPWAEEPGRLQSMGSLRVGHDWVTSLSLFTFMHWRRKWHPTPVFLPGESQGRGSLVGYHLWGHAESDMTEVT